MKIYQTTIKDPVRFKGIGLHSGEKVTLTIKPAPPDTGIIFIRTDLNPPMVIEAVSRNVLDTRFATTLGKDGVRISTVEHLLAAFFGLGIDNVIVEVDSSEIPIMDGSAAPFVYLLKNAGIVEQDKPRRFLFLNKPIKVIEDGRIIKIVPSKELKISYTIEFDHPLIRRQSLSLSYSPKVFEKEISPARTFAFLKDVEKLRREGYAKGGSLENALVVDDSRVLNPDGLRFEDEFVRHKILDFMGDLALLGSYVIGHVIVYKGGHALNLRLVERILEEKGAWRYITFEDKREQPIEKQFLFYPAFQIS